MEPVSDPKHFRAESPPELRLEVVEFCPRTLVLLTINAATLACFKDRNYYAVAKVVIVSTQRCWRRKGRRYDVLMTCAFGLMKLPRVACQVLI